MARKLVKQSDGTYRWVETKKSSSRSRARQADNIQAKYNDGTNTKEQTKAELERIGFNPTGNVAKSSTLRTDNRDRRKTFNNKTIYDYKDNVTVNTPKTTTGGGFDFDNPNDYTGYTPAQQAVIDRAIKAEAANNQSSGGKTTGLKKSALLQQAFQKANANRSVSTAITQQNIIASAGQPPIRGENEDYESFQKRKEQYAATLKQKKAEAAEVAAVEAQSNVDNTEDIPNEFDQFLDEPDLVEFDPEAVMESDVYQELKDEGDDRVNELKADLARKKERQEKELTDAIEAQNKATESAISAAKFRGDSAAFAEGIRVNGEEAIQKMQETYNMNLIDLETEYGKLIDNAEDDAANTLKSYIETNRQAVADQNEEIYKRWKDQRDYTFKVQKEYNDQARAESTDARLDRAADLSEKRYNLDVQKTIRDDYYKQWGIDKDMAEFYHDNYGSVANGVVADIFAQIGRPFPPELLNMQTNAEKAALLKATIDQVNLSSNVGKLPTSVVKTFEGILDDETFARAMAISKAIAIEKASGKAGVKSAKLTSTQALKAKELGIDAVYVSDLTSEQAKQMNIKPDDSDAPSKATQEKYFAITGKRLKNISDATPDELSFLLQNDDDFLAEAQRVAAKRAETDSSWKDTANNLSNMMLNRFAEKDPDVATSLDETLIERKAPKSSGNSELQQMLEEMLNSNE
jgi:hypothetical protein